MTTYASASVSNFVMPAAGNANFIRLVFQASDNDQPFGFFGKPGLPQDYVPQGLIIDTRGISTALEVQVTVGGVLPFEITAPAGTYASYIVPAFANPVISVAGLQASDELVIYTANFPLFPQQYGNPNVTINLSSPGPIGNNTPNTGAFTDLKADTLEVSGIATFYVATIADLRALSSATTAATSSVSGYAAAADGGGGTFVVNANDTTSADNGGTIIVDAAGRRWYRVYSGAVNVVWFGADPTGTADSTAAFSAAAAASLSPIIPAGTYLLNSNPTGSAIWRPQVGVVLTGAGILQGTVARVPAGDNQITVYVDAVNGADGPLKGRTTGTGACQTIQQAFNNIAQEWDFNGNNYVPLIQCASGQTFSGGLDLQGGQTNTPFLVGCNQVTLDGGTSTITNPSGNTIFLRGYPLWLRIQNMTLTAPGGGNLIEVYGGGTHVEFNGGLTFGAVNSPYAQLSATRYGRMSIYPGSTGYTISGGGGIFAQAIIGGRIELEGAEISINSGLTYSVAFIEADGSGSAVEFFNIAWTGSNITGPSFLAKNLGEINLSGQVGGQTINLPLAGGGGASGGPSVTTGNFTGDGCNGYLPGSTPGAFGFVGGQITDATPPTVTGAGTGPTVQGVEPGFLAILGTGNGSTNGTQYSFTVTFGTTSNWRGAIVGTNDPGSLSNLHAIYTGPSGTTPGNIEIYYTGTGYSPDGKVVTVYLLPADPNT